MIDNFNMSKWVQDLHLKESQIREFDGITDVDRILNSLESTINGMMDSSAHIERTLRSEPELEWKLEEVTMDIGSLNQKLRVLKEKLSL
tara:strand:- start:1099 stop:1365 length:267 start_codon:yes stop_codon:yes gene_type:complete